jgi:hypothetical protein
LTSLVGRGAVEWTGEHLFDKTSILPEHLFAVNHIHNIELVFASGQPRC